MPTFRFGDFDFATAPYHVESVQGPFEDSERDMLSEEFARRAGGRLLATRHRMRAVTVRGFVIGGTRESLRRNWERLELAFSREAQQLRVNPDMGDRYYVATKRSLGGPWPGDDLHMVRYAAVFDVPTPFALAPDASQDDEGSQALAFVAGSEYRYAWDIAPGGTVYAEPKFTLTFPASTLLAEYDETNRHYDVAFGHLADQAKRSQGFKFAGASDAARVMLWLSKIGAPADNVVVEIQNDDGAGKPNNVVVADGTSDNVPASRIPSGGGWVAAYFPDLPSLAGATQYHIVAKRSGALDAANYYRWGIDATGAYGDGWACLGTNANVWSAAAAYDHIFAVYDALSPYGVSKLWVVNTSLSPPQKAVVVETFEGGDVVIIDSGEYAATIDGVRATDTEGMFPTLDPRAGNNALEVRAIADRQPTLSLVCDWRARYLN